VDLRIQDEAATAAERDAVDSLLGTPESGWDGGTRQDSDLRYARGGHAARDRRDLLLPALHAVNDRVGWISRGALDHICRRLTVPPAEAYAVASFYAMFALHERPRRVVHLCTDIACAAGTMVTIVRKATTTTVITNCLLSLRRMCRACMAASLCVNRPSRRSRI
jgi:NADH-quinone oxidoreductase subunit F